MPTNSYQDLYNETQHIHALITQYHKELKAHSIDNEDHLIQEVAAAIKTAESICSSIQKKIQAEKNSSNRQDPHPQLAAFINGFIKQAAFPESLNIKINDLTAKDNAQKVIQRLQELTTRKEVIGQNHINIMISHLKKYVNLIKNGSPVKESNLSKIERASLKNIKLILKEFVTYRKAIKKQIDDFESYLLAHQTRILNSSQSTIKLPNPQSTIVQMLINSDIRELVDNNVAGKIVVNFYRLILTKDIKAPELIKRVKESIRQKVASKDDLISQAIKIRDTTALYSPISVAITNYLDNKNETAKAKLFEKYYEEFFKQMRLINTVFTELIKPF